MVASGILINIQHIQNATNTSFVSVYYGWRQSVITHWHIGASRKLQKDVSKKQEMAMGSQGGRGNQGRKGKEMEYNEIKRPSWSAEHA